MQDIIMLAVGALLLACGIAGYIKPQLFESKDPNDTGKTKFAKKMRPLLIAVGGVIVAAEIMLLVV